MSSRPGSPKSRSVSNSPRKANPGSQRAAPPSSSEARGRSASPSKKKKEPELSAEQLKEKNRELEKKVQEQEKTRESEAKKKKKTEDAAKKKLAKDVKSKESEVKKIDGTIKRLHNTIERYHKTQDSLKTKLKEFNDQIQQKLQKAEEDKRQVQKNLDEEYQKHSEAGATLAYLKKVQEKLVNEGVLIDCGTASAQGSTSAATSPRSPRRLSPRSESSSLAISPTFASDIEDDNIDLPAVADLRKSTLQLDAMMGDGDLALLGRDSCLDSPLPATSNSPRDDAGAAAVTEGPETLRQELQQSQQALADKNTEVEDLRQELWEALQSAKLAQEDKNAEVEGLRQELREALQAAKPAREMRQSGTLDTDPLIGDVPHALAKPADRHLPASAASRRQELKALCGKLQPQAGAPSWQHSTRGAAGSPDDFKQVAEAAAGAIRDLECQVEELEAACARSPGAQAQKAQQAAIRLRAVLGASDLPSHRRQALAELCSRLLQQPASVESLPGDAAAHVDGLVQEAEREARSLQEDAVAELRDLRRKCQHLQLEASQASSMAVQLRQADVDARSLRDAFDRCEAEMEELRTQLDGSRRAGHNALAELPSLQAQARDAEVEAERLRGSLYQCKGEIAELRAQLDRSRRLDRKPCLPSAAEDLARSLWHPPSSPQSAALGTPPTLARGAISPLAANTASALSQSGARSPLAADTAASLALAATRSTHSPGSPNSPPFPEMRALVAEAEAAAQGLRDTLKQRSEEVEHVKAQLRQRNTKVSELRAGLLQPGAAGCGLPSSQAQSRSPRHRSPAAPPSLGHTERTFADFRGLLNDSAKKPLAGWPQEPIATAAPRATSPLAVPSLPWSPASPPSAFSATRNL